jgi:hypothetical protein
MGMGANETRLWRLLVSFKDPDHLKKVTAMLRAHKPIQPRPIYSGHFLKNRATKWSVQAPCYQCARLALNGASGRLRMIVRYLGNHFVDFLLTTNPANA